MAQSLDAARAKINTSIHGRKAGLTYDDFMVGYKDNIVQLLDIQSTTPNTAVPNYGLFRVLTTGSSQGPVQHTLQAPVIGIKTTLILNTTSTGSNQFLAPSGVSILAASDGTTKALVNLIGQGGSVTLTGVTTAIYAVTGFTGGVSYTTST